MARFFQRILDEREVRFLRVRDPQPALGQDLRAARRGLSALLSVWKLEAALGLSRGRGGRFPGEPP